MTPPWDPTRRDLDYHDDVFDRTGVTVQLRYPKWDAPKVGEKIVLEESVGDPARKSGRVAMAVVAEVKEAEPLPGDPVRWVLLKLRVVNIGDVVEIEGRRDDG